MDADATSSTWSAGGQQAHHSLQRIWQSLPLPNPLRGRKQASSYPPVSSIPQTSPERLTQASPDKPDSDASTTTVLYLAYGSNLSASKFLGDRGIRPLSKINVSAPSWDLSFDLPGLPYTEPCFANTTPRRKLPPFKPPKPPVIRPPPTTTTNSPLHDKDSSFPFFPSLPPDHTPKWTKGLIGVVYEVTKEDYYTKIIATESSQYRDIPTPCIPLPPPIGVPEHPPIPELPRPFLARTLYAPHLPPELPDPPNDNDTPTWWRKLVSPVVRKGHAADYAQPSPRYLGLILEGAAQHFLPEDYQTYLAELQAYTITRRRQLVGKWLFLLLWGPLLGLLFLLSKLSTVIGGGGSVGGNSDDGGGDRFPIPKWLAIMETVIFNLMWTSYDRFFFERFGDGERTMEDGDADDEESRVGGQYGKHWEAHDGSLAEKSGLLADC